MSSSVCIWQPKRTTSRPAHERNKTRAPIQPCRLKTLWLNFVSKILQTRDDLTSIPAIIHPSIKRPTR